MKRRYVILVVGILLAFFCGETVNAQYIQDLNGRPIATHVTLDVEGSQFLYEDFIAGSVKFAYGATFKDILLKYNQLEDELYFIGKQKDTLTFVDPVQEFTLDDMQGNKRHFKNGFPTIDKNTNQSYYEVLAGGTIQVLKRESVVITESKEYNSSTVRRAISRSTKYYFVKSGQIAILKKDKKSILALLDDKQNEMEDYIKFNNLNVKDDTDLIKLINHYNSI